MKKEIAATFENTIKKIKDTDIGAILNDARSKMEDISKNPAKHIGEFILQLELAYEMLSCYSKKECKFPWKTVAALAAALVYFLNPFDVIPDFIPGVGYIDDLAVLGIAFTLMKDDLKSYAKEHNINLKDYGLE